MLTCGMYDGAGEFAFRIGIPGKSGVGGGIITVVPDAYRSSMVTRVDKSGNSLAGCAALIISKQSRALNILSGCRRQYRKC